MPKKHAGSPDPFEKELPLEQEIDYSPKTYTLKENLLSFGKMSAIAAFFLALVWLIEKYVV